MNWDSLAGFIDMGGYGLYVWGSYAMCAGALAWEAMMLFHRRRCALEALHEEPGPNDGGP
jgi:heme exporter protein D